MENKTTITSNQVDINNTVGMTLDANKAELYSTNGNVPIFAKCGDKEIKLIDEKGNTYLNSLTVNGKSVDDTKTTTGYLWTAAQIISNTSAQIAAEGVTTYSGTTVPSNSLGKNGYIYVLIES